MAKSGAGIRRRDFIKDSMAAVGVIGAAGIDKTEGAATGRRTKRNGEATDSRNSSKYNAEYTGERLNRIAFPMGGIGAGMICLEGTGALSHVSIRNHPEVFNAPCIFAAVSVKQGRKKRVARVLEGPVPGWRLFGAPGSANGGEGSSYGLPRFRNASFLTRFPFATITLRDQAVPVHVDVTGWSPFEPGAADDSSLPVAGLEYSFTNPTADSLDVVLSFNSKNSMPVGATGGSVKPIKGGFVLHGAAPKERPWEEGDLSVTTAEPGAKVNHAWFRGGWWDALTLAWKDVQEGVCYDRPPVTEGGASPGASLFVPFRLSPGESKTVSVRIAWYAGQTNLRIGKDPGKATESGNYRPWYAGRFKGIEGVASHWATHYDELRTRSKRFSDCFYDTSLPPEVVEAVAANLTIIKSPTVMRQADGRLWNWEGCADNNGCCHGSCTHVWNYAQAIPHLFPSLERTLRETEFGPSQDESGHQQFRSALPIRLVAHDFHAAADGQLGGIMKVYRDWRICGDTEWLRRLWPKVKKSLDYCIETWDPGHKGVVEEPHHNTYDIEFWGPDGMCTSFYLGALKAASLMGKALGENTTTYDTLLENGSRAAETELYNGAYFIQKIEWKNLRAKNPLENKSMVGAYSQEAVEVFQKEGPKYQYGTGCLSDGVLGSWMALVCGAGQVMDRSKVSSHLKSIHKHNLKRDLSDHSNPQRPTYACGSEGGLLLCTWPRGGELSLPFVYSNEVWTGIEYQVASHLILMGHVNEGLEIVRVCRDRYDGRIRNPFNEYECGHWYARAMSSYALLQSLTGARYDAVEKILYVNPPRGGDFHGFFAAQGAYGTVGVRNGTAYFEPKSGSLEVKEIRFTPAST